MAAPRRINLLDRPPPPAEVKKSPVSVAPPAETGTFAIEDDVPIPEKITRKPVTERMPFALLEIGQSFVVPGPRAAKNSFFWVKRAQIRLPGKYFVARKIDNGVRIWRVAESAK